MVAAGVVFNKYCGVGDAGPILPRFFEGRRRPTARATAPLADDDKALSSTTTCVLLIGQMKFGGKKSLRVPIVNHNLYGGYWGSRS